jgi:Zn-dependent metalloprotease
MCNNLSCIMPPHILNEIIKRGKPRHKKWAMNTLLNTARMQGHRDILRRYDLTGADNGLYRVVQSAKNTLIMNSGQTLRKEGQAATGDPAVDEAYDYMGDAYNFYMAVFNRNSFDDKGGKLFATVHFGQKYDNAFWDGERQCYGDGDGEIFQRFTKCPEVIGHETAHGVTQNGANLTYENMSGALNEANSDIFGSLIKQYALGQTANEADWIVGEGLLEPSIIGVGVRSIANPGTAYDDPLLGKDPCPATMDDYVNTTEDNGGIHINCTIPAHAFYVAAMELGGYAWQTMGPIWYLTVTQYADAGCDFDGWKACTLRAARTIYGKNSKELKATSKGWQAVGL